MIVRVAPDVRAVVATLSDGTREDLRLHGDADLLGVRIAVLVYPAELDLHRLACSTSRATNWPTPSDGPAEPGAVGSCSTARSPAAHRPTAMPLRRSPRAAA